MPSLTDLEKQLKTATKTGKYVVGRREVFSSLKGSKLLVWSSSANIPPVMLEQSKALQIPALRFEGNPIDLGHACGIPFKVSVIAIKSQGDSDLSPFANSSDYTATRTGGLPISVSGTEPRKGPPEKVETSKKANKAEEKNEKVTEEAPKEKKTKKKDKKKD
jgi:large subunit ribosomal protein L30e